MSYLICEKCGKYYQLDEGKSSFNFERCECGGKLKYSASLKDTGIKRTPEFDGSHLSGRSGLNIKWRGIIIGYIFLFVALSTTVIAVFGTNIPTNPLEIPSNQLIIFTILSIIMTLISGFISAYLGLSRKYKEGIFYGGMVGVLLGIFMGFVGGITALISVSLVFGFISMIGGVMATLIRNKLQGAKN